MTFLIEEDERINGTTKDMLHLRDKHTHFLVFFYLRSQRCKAVFCEPVSTKMLNAGAACVEHKKGEQEGTQHRPSTLVTCWSEPAFPFPTLPLTAHLWIRTSLPQVILLRDLLGLYLLSVSNSLALQDPSCREPAASGLTASLCCQVLPFLQDFTSSQEQNPNSTSKAHQGHNQT